VLLLTYIPNEEDAFWCLVFVMFDKDWRGIFIARSPKMERILQDLEIYIKETWPVLH
jgi:hypothetical protein